MILRRKNSYKNLILSEATFGGLPLAYWPMNEVAGSLRADLMTLARGTGFTGTMNGTGYSGGNPGPISHEQSLSTHFVPATTDYMNAALVTNATSSVSMECWFKTYGYTVDGQGVMYNGSDNNGNGYGFFINQETESTGLIRILYGGLTWYTAGANIIDSLWHHGVLIIKANSHPAFFLDGASVFDGSSGAAPNAPTLKTQIGKDDYIDSHPTVHRYFWGDIAHAAIYGYVLSADRIKAHYVAGKTGVRR